MASLLAVSSFAQKNEGGIALNAGAGFSMFGILGRISFSIPDDFSIDANSSTAWCGSLDYAIQNNFSIGIGGGYQKISGTITDHQYMDENGNIGDASFSYSTSRLNAGLRLMFHYGSGKSDVYSGLKLGANIFDVQIQNGFDVPFSIGTSGTSFGFQIVPIGYRGYIGKNVGIFIETGIGAPTFISGGLCFGINALSEIPQKR